MRHQNGTRNNYIPDTEEATISSKLRIKSTIIRTSSTARTPVQVTLQGEGMLFGNTAPVWFIIILVQNLRGEHIHRLEQQASAAAETAVAAETVVAAPGHQCHVHV